MIKAVAQLKNGRPLLLLGLSAENVRRLQDDKPIHFGMAVNGIELEVAIIYGETELAMVDQFRAMGLDLPTAPADAVATVFSVDVKQKDPTP